MLELPFFDLAENPPQGIAMIDYLAELELPTIVVMTKADKLSRLGAEERASGIMKNLSLEKDQTILFSSVTGQGRTELAEALASLVDPTQTAQ